MIGRDLQASPTAIAGSPAWNWSDLPDYILDTNTQYDVRVYVYNAGAGNVWWDDLTIWTARAPHDNAISYVEGAGAVAVSQSGLASDQENAISAVGLTLSGLADGTSEQIRLGSTQLDLSTSSTSTISLAGLPTLSVQVTSGATPAITITRESGGVFTAAETSQIVRAITYTHASETPTAGIRNISWQLTDNGGSQSTQATTTITVTPVNDAPLDGNETNTTNEDTTLTVADGATGDLLNNATDVDGNPLTITAFSVAGQAGPFTVGSPFLISGVGTLTVNANGSYTFAPAANYNGAVPVITYTVSDGQGGSDTSTLTLSVPQ